MNITFTYDDIADHAATWIYTNCQNVGTKYSSLPNYVKQGFNKTVNIKKTRPPDPGISQYRIKEVKPPRVKWTLFSNFIPSKITYTKTTIKTKILTFTNTSTIKNSKPSADNILGYFYKLADFCVKNLVFYRQNYKEQISGANNPVGFQKKTYLVYDDKTNQTLGNISFTDDDIIHANTINDIFIKLINVIKNQLMVKNIVYTVTVV